MQSFILNLLAESKSSLERKVMVALYLHKTLTETYLVNENNISCKNLTEGLKRLVDEGVLERKRKDLDVIYYFSKSIIKANQKCDGCEYTSKTYCGDVETIGCNFRKSEMDCVYGKDRILYNTAKVLDKNTVEASCYKISRTKSKKDIVRATEDWKMIDFHKYYCEQMINKHGNIILEDYNQSKKNWDTIKNQFKEINPEKWRMLMKFYIHWMISLHNARTIFSLTNIASLRLYMSEKALSILKVKLCTFHEIFCPHFINQKCNFAGGEKVCTPALREVYKHYN